MSLLHVQNAKWYFYKLESWRTNSNGGGGNAVIATDIDYSEMGGGKSNDDDLHGRNSYWIDEYRSIGTRKGWENEGLGGYE